MTLETQISATISDDSQNKLEWQEPSFELLNTPEGGGGGFSETFTGAPS